MAIYLKAVNTSRQKLDICTQNLRQFRFREPLGPQNTRSRFEGFEVKLYRFVDVVMSDRVATVLVRDIVRAFERFRDGARLFLRCSKSAQPARSAQVALSPPGWRARAIFSKSSFECASGSKTFRFSRRSNWPSSQSVRFA